MKLSSILPPFCLFWSDPLVGLSLPVNPGSDLLPVNELKFNISIHHEINGVYPLDAVKWTLKLTDFCSMVLKVLIMKTLGKYF